MANYTPATIRRIHVLTLTFFTASINFNVPIDVLFFTMVRPEDGCFTATDGNDYRGCVNVSATGRPCQHWTSQFPNTHDRTPTNYPGYGLGDHNFCRNPDGEPMVWCYINDLTHRWEYCNVGEPGHCSNTTIGPTTEQESKCILYFSSIYD